MPLVQLLLDLSFAGIDQRRCMLESHTATYRHDGWSSSRDDWVGGRSALCSFGLVAIIAHVILPSWFTFRYFYSVPAKSFPVHIPACSILRLSSIMATLHVESRTPVRGRIQSMQPEATEQKPQGIPQDSHPKHPRKKFVLCFDGTGNKFSGTDSDSNILKIYRMLDRNDSTQFHYYQPGIGTYVTTDSLSHTSKLAQVKSWYLKAKDSAVGISFDQHVMGGYKVTKVLN
jgi:hypothetical protein